MSADERGKPVPLEIVARFDRAFRHVAVNDAVAAVTGKPRSDWIGRTSREMGMPAPLCDRFEAQIRTVFETGRESIFDFDYEGPSGRHVFTSHVVPEMGADGAVREVVSITRDVTEERAAVDALRRRIAFEATLAAVSARFVAPPDLDRAIMESLADMSRLAGASRAYVFVFRGDTMRNTHEWCAPGVKPQIDNLQDLPTAAFPWWMERLRANESIHVKDVASMTPEASAERALLEEQDIKSVLVFPMSSGDTLAGFVGFDDVEKARGWGEQDLALLRVAARIVGDALARRAREEAIRVSEGRYRLLVAQSPLSTQVLAPDGSVALVNRAWEELWGVRLKDIPGWSWRLDPQLKAAGITPHLERAFAGEMVEIPARAYVPDRGRYAGTERWVRAVAYPVRDGEGNIQEVVVLQEDITSSREAERAREESEARFRRIFEDAPVGMALVGGDLRPVSVNGALCRMLGYSAEELRAMTFSEFTHPDDVEADMALAQRLIAGEIPHYQLEKRYVRKDGGIVWGSLTVSAVYDANRRILHLVGIVEDVTERRRAEAALAASRHQLAVSEKMAALGALVSGVAHEIRTPLTYVSNNLYLLVREAEQAAKADELPQEVVLNLTDRARAAIDGVDRINHLVGSLRGYARLGQGKRRALPLKPVVQEAIDLFRATARGRLRLSARLDDDVVATVDREQVQQIVLNLLANAADASPSGATIRVTLRGSEKEAEVAVEDEGGGVPDSVAEVMFEPFFTTKEEGTGLGLSISKRLADAHGGALRYEPTARGARFVLQLPRA